MRQVDERERWPARVVDVPGAVGNPPARGDVRRRSPEVEQWKSPEPALELLAKLGRRRVNVGELSPVRRVHGPGRDGVGGGRIHVVPPEEIRAGEGRIAPGGRLPD